MNPSSDTGPAVAVDRAGESAQAPFPTHWRQALMTLISSRFTLIELESKEAARDWGRRGAMITAACGCVFFGWILVLAGTVSLIADTAGWPWNLVAIAMAVAHLLAAIVLFTLAKSSANTTFPVTRAEFTKDREWIEKFHKARKSND